MLLLGDTLEWKVTSVNFSKSDIQVTQSIGKGVIGHSFCPRKLKFWLETPPKGALAWEGAGGGLEGVYHQKSYTCQF